MPASSAKPGSDSLAALRIDRSGGPRRSRFADFLKAALALVLVALLTGGGLIMARRAGWVSSTFAVPEMIQSRTEVEVASVTVQTGRSGDATVVATGYLESRRQAKIGARVPGRIEEIHVEEGSRVKANDVMAVLEHADMDASLAAAEAAAARARSEVAEQEIEIARSERDFERIKRLWEMKSVSEEEYDRSEFQHRGAVARLGSLKAAVLLAEARVKEADQLRKNMYVVAPFDGTVISKDAELGESILPGGMGEASGRGSVVTIADLEHLEVECDVKEDFISRVIVGGEAEVAVDAVPDRRYAGRVRKVIPMGDRARATIKVKVEILDVDHRLFPDMSSTVYFLPAESEQRSNTNARRVFCPSDAIRNDEEGEFVWVVTEESRVARQRITAGKPRDGTSEVAAGLTGGERVVVNPPATLRVNQLVKF